MKYSRKGTNDRIKQRLKLYEEIKNKLIADGIDPEKASVEAYDRVTTKPIKQIGRMIHCGETEK